jgi:uncharacterized protein (TIGR02217 family)
LGAVGGPVRKTEIVTLVSGHEKRNAKWANSRRNYNAGFGVKSIGDLQVVIAFFEERRGQLYGFRFRDPLDFTSCKPSLSPAATDQKLGIGNDTTTIFQLIKNYGSTQTVYSRIIQKPVASSLVVAVDALIKTIDVDFTLDDTTGQITFLPGAIPTSGEQITAGFEFDVPVRFDTDEIAINLSAFQAGEIPSIPMIEIKT